MNYLQAKNYLETSRRARAAAIILARDCDYVLPKDARAFVDQAWGELEPDRFDSPRYRDLVADWLRIVIGQQRRESRKAQ